MSSTPPSSVCSRPTPLRRRSRRRSSSGPEFYAKPRADRIGAIAEYRKVYGNYPDGTEAAAVAKIRVADLVPDGDFRGALTSLP